MNDLDLFRVLIDNIDSAILSILLHRAKVIHLIQHYKKLHNISIEQSEIRKKSLEDLFAFAKKLDLDEQFVDKIMQYLFAKRENLYPPEEFSALSNIMKHDDNRLAEFNRTLERVDMSFCCLLSERMQLVKQVGEYKKTQAIKPLDSKRWEEVLIKKSKIAESLNINPDVISELYNMIHDEALRIEANIVNND